MKERRTFYGKSYRKLYPDAHCLKRVHNKQTLTEIKVEVNAFLQKRLTS